MSFDITSVYYKARSKLFNEKRLYDTQVLPSVYTLQYNIHFLHAC